MSEYKRRSYAVDDVTYINQRLKEIEKERAEAINQAGEPEPDPFAAQAAGVWAMAANASLVDPFWQKLIDAGILEVVDPGEA